MDKKKVIVLAPHIDDGELGCGATIAKLIQKEIPVYYVAFSTCEESIPEGFPRNILEKEVKKATMKLAIEQENLIIKKYPVRHFPEYRQQILEDLVYINKKLNPDLVFTPSSFDVHQDHKTIYEESTRAFKNISILGYEFMWNNYSFGATLFSVVSGEHIQAKINAIKEYNSQKKRFYAAEKMIKGLANYRGLQISKEYAEAFEVIRWILI